MPIAVGPEPGDPQSESRSAGRVRSAGIEPGSGARTHDPRLVGEDDRLRPVAQPELGEDRGDVGLHGRLADDERSAISALLRPRASRPRTSRSRAVRSPRAPRSPARAVGPGRANRSTSRRVIDGASSASPTATRRTAATSCSGGDVLEQEPARARLERRVDVLVEIERGQDDHPRRVRRRTPVERARRVASSRRGPACGCPSARRRAVSPGQADRGLAVRGLADDLDVGLGLEDHPEAGPDERLVVGDEDPTASTRPTVPPVAPTSGAAAATPGPHTRRRAVARPRAVRRPATRARASPQAPPGRRRRAGGRAVVRISTRSCSGSQLRRTSVAARRAYRSAFVSASWTIR